MTPLLQVENFSKAFLAKKGFAHTLSLRILSRFKKQNLSQSIYVFEKLNLSIFPGECLAIHGINGSGKSTLLRCLAGVTAPTEGFKKSNATLLALLSHGFGAYEDLATWRNMLLVQQLFGLNLEKAEKNIEKLASIAGLSDRLDSPSSQLSEGMRAKIAISALYFCSFDLLLIDESLNHVDAEFRSWFHALTREWISMGRSIVITSHDSTLLEQFGTRHLRMENKSLISLA